MANDFFIKAKDMEKLIRDLSRNQRDVSKDVRDAVTSLKYFFSRGPEGGYSVSEVGQRARRIEFEIRYNDAALFKKRSDELFAADRAIAEGARYKSADRYIKGEELKRKHRLKVLREESAKATAEKQERKIINDAGFRYTNPNDSNVIREYSKKYGWWGTKALDKDIRIAELAYTDPMALEMEELTEKYGSAGADRIITAKNDARVRKAKEGRQSARAKGRFAYNYDMMNAYDQERFDLIQRYGGGDEGRAMADVMMEERRKARMRVAESRASVSNRRERIHYMKEYPNFFKNSKMTAKEVKNIAKMIKRWEKAPIFGQILKVAGKSPLGIEGTVGLAALTGLNWFAQNADEANKNVVQWKNMQNLSGKASDAFTAAAYYAGIDNPGEISKRFGIATLKYGDAEKFYRIMGANMANLPPIARMAIAQKLGWDETDVAIADIFSGRIGFDKTRDMNATRNMVSAGTTLGFATGSGFWNTLNAALSTLFQAVGARTINSMDQFRFLQEISKKIIDSGNGANNAAESADKFKSNGYNLDDKQSSARSVNITINTGDLSLPNVQNANDFVVALSNEGIRRSHRAEILTTFDTMAV